MKSAYDLMTLSRACSKARIWSLDYSDLVGMAIASVFDHGCSFQLMSALGAVEPKTLREEAQLQVPSCFLFRSEQGAIFETEEWLWHVRLQFYLVFFSCQFSWKDDANRPLRGLFRIMAAFATGFLSTLLVACSVHSYDPFMR